MRENKYVEMSRGQDKINSFNIFLGLCFSAIISLSSILLTVPNLDKKIIKIRRIYSVNSSQFTKVINLPRRSDYVFKIKYDLRNTDIEMVALNGEKLELRISNNKDVIRTCYYYAPEKIVKKGANFLKIKFYPSNPPNIDLRIKNYITKIADKNVILAFKNSFTFNIRNGSLLFVLMFIFSFVLWLILSLFNELLKVPNILKILYFLIYSFLLLAIGVASSISPYSLVISPMFLAVITSLFLLFILVLNVLYVKLQPKSNSIDAVEEIFINRSPKIIRKYLTKLCNKILLFVSLRLFEKCILISVLLFVVSFIFLIFKLNVISKTLTHIAFFFLIIGMGDRFLNLLKEEK